MKENKMIIKLMEAVVLLFIPTRHCRVRKLEILSRQ